MPNSSTRRSRRLERAAQHEPLDSRIALSIAFAVLASGSYPGSSAVRRARRSTSPSSRVNPAMSSHQSSAAGIPVVQSLSGQALVFGCSAAQASRASGASPRRGGHGARPTTAVPLHHAVQACATDRRKSPQAVRSGASGRRKPPPSRRSAGPRALAASASSDGAGIAYTSGLDSSAACSSSTLVSSLGVSRAVFDARRHKRLGQPEFPPLQALPLAKWILPHPLAAPLISSEATCWLSDLTLAENLRSGSCDVASGSGATTVGTAHYSLPASLPFSESRPQQKPVRLQHRRELAFIRHAPGDCSFLLAPRTVIADTSAIDTADTQQSPSSEATGSSGGDLEGLRPHELLRATCSLTPSGVMVRAASLPAAFDICRFSSGLKRSSSSGDLPRQRTVESLGASSCGSSSAGSRVSSRSAGCASRAFSSVSTADFFERSTVFADRSGRRHLQLFPLLFPPVGEYRPGKDKSYL